MDSSVIWYAVLAAVVVALVFVLFNFNKVKKMKEGNDEMVEMAGIIRSGAGTFLKAEFKVIAIIGVIIALVFSLFVEATSGITFLLGGLMSSLVCIIGMKSATYANVRTANKARESLSIGETVKVALSGGSVSGIAVQAFGMLGLLLLLIIWGVDPHATGHGLVANLECNPSIMRITTYSLGCSIVAMFNRVAGGNYTKAADISSDILAKIRHDMPEDDSRVPNVIADFIGDNVNDIAGNCSDLLESFVATIAASIMIAVTLFINGIVNVSDETFIRMIIFPVILAGVGLIGCLIGLSYAFIRKMGDDPSRELNLATWISAGITVILGLVASYMFRYMKIWSVDGYLRGFQVSSVSSAELRSEVLQNIIPVTNTSRRKNWQRWQSRARLSLSQKVMRSDPVPPYCLSSSSVLPCLSPEKSAELME